MLFSLELETIIFLDTLGDFLIIIDTLLGKLMKVGIQLFIKS